MTTDESIIPFILFENKINELVAVPDLQLTSVVFSRAEGDYKKKILIVFNSPTNDVVKEKTIFQKIIQASGMQMNAIKLLPLYSEDEITFSQISQHFTPDYLFLFGIAPAELRWNVLLPINKMITLEKMKVMSTESILKIDADKATKMAFWAAWTFMLNIQPLKK